MAENFLEEQLKRIREMSERMTRVSDRAAELSAEVARDRASMKSSPLDQVKDFRSHTSIEIDRPSSARDHRARPSSRSTRNRRK